MHETTGFGKSLVSALALVFSASASSAWAAGIETLPAVQLHVTSDLGIDAVYDAASMGCESASGYAGFAASCNGYDYDLGGATLSSLNVTFVVDPEVHLNISLINTSSVAQTFTLETTLPTDPFGGPNRMGGSVGGSITDTNGAGSGATVSAVAGSGIYTALIDGLDVQLLHAAPFSVSAPGNFTSASIAPVAFGEPIPSAAAPSVLGSIGIRLRFRLSPGDQVALTSVFVVQTPEPATAGLLGAAGLALFALRRRSRA